MSDVFLPLFGHDAAEREISEALRCGKMHHAWLLEGPSGIGKSRLATRAAAVLLGAQRLDANRLDVAALDPIVEKLVAGAHPDFRLLSRVPDEKGKMPLYISVDRVRTDLVDFLVLKSALGGRRVCIVDAIDELNANGANALLKSLEEPPADCVILLIYHGDRAILPTIRSRCRRLRLGGLDDAELEDALKLNSVEVKPAALSYAKGRPGRAALLSRPSAIAAISAAKLFGGELEKGGVRSVGRIFAAASADDDAFAAFADAMLRWAAENEHPKAWLWLSRLLDQATRDAMERGQTTAKLISGLQTELETA